MGSNPAESKTQLLSLAGLCVLRKHAQMRDRDTGSGEQPSAATRPSVRSNYCGVLRRTGVASPSLELFHFDGCAGVDELLLDGRSLVFADTFLNGLRSAVH